MTCSVVLNPDGTLYSFTSGPVAEPLPEGRTTAPISDADYDQLRSGGTWVDGAVVPRAPVADNAVEIAEAREALATAEPAAVGACTLAYLDLLIPPPT